MVAAAAADPLAERAPLEAEAAAGARGRQNLHLHEERAHERGPEEEVGDEEGATHVGFYRQGGPIGLPLS